MYLLENLLFQKYSMSLYEYGLVLQKTIDSFLFRVPDCNIIPKLKAVFIPPPTTYLQLQNIYNLDYYITYIES